MVAFWLNFPRSPPDTTDRLFSDHAGVGHAHLSERRVRTPRTLTLVVSLQFLLEIVIESSIIYTTGGINSPFSALFILTIVSAGLAYRLVGTLIIASIVSVGFAGIVWFGVASGQLGSEVTLQAIARFVKSEDAVLYSIFLHVLIFYLVAFISGYLAERLSTQDKKLADASQALRRARLETDDILRHLNSGLLTLDPQGCIIYFNRAAEKILGYEEERVKGLRCDEVFAERMPRLAEALLQGLLYGIEHPRRELEIVDRRGTVIPLGISTSVLRDEDLELRGVIAIFSDLTAAKVLENQVRAADRLAAVGELSASIAHEIRNPLAAISGSVEVLRSDLQVSDANARLMELIVKESHRLSKILTDFLTYARISRPAYCKVELCHVVSDVIDLIRNHQAYRETVEVRFDSREAYVYVVGDEDLIKQLLVNLAFNASEAFDGRPGEVTFSISGRDGIVLLSVADNGPGIPANIQERIFQPFFSTKKQGTGLGLSIVHRICSILKLTMTVDSTEGAGTTFSVRFREQPTEDDADREPLIRSSMIQV